MAFKLSLPKIDEHADPTVETRAVYLEEWAEGLAYANPPRLLEQVFASLQALNKQPLKPSHRLALMELHVKPYCFALEFKRKQRTALTSQAMERQRAVSRQLRKCAISMALGYKQALSQRNERRTRFGASREHALLLQRSLLFTGLALMHCYEAYRPAVEGLWREFTALYKFAARSELDQQDVNAPVDDELFSRSSAHIFKRFCLCALTDPYHLAYGELWQIFQVLAPLVNDVAIEQVGRVTRPAGVFVVDPTRDEPPTAYSHRAGDISESCRLLDAKPVHAKLQSIHRSKGTSQPLPAHVLSTMIRALGLPPKRHTPREPSEGRVVVVGGLGGVHHFLTPGNDPKERGTQTEDKDAEIEVGSATSVEMEFTASYATESWQLMDEGPGGMGLERDKAPQLPLGVGDLAGLRFPLRGDAQDDWTLTVVRWIHIEPNGRHQIGLQLLSEQVVAVMAYTENPQDTITQVPRPALALPRISSQAGASLIFSRGLLAVGDQLRMVDGDDSHRLALTARIEGTGAFERFSYRLEE